MTKSFSAMVVGAGAWGTAIASVFARGGNKTLLWDRDRTTIAVSYTHLTLPTILLE